MNPRYQYLCKAVSSQMAYDKEVGTVDVEDGSLTHLDEVGPKLSAKMTDEEKARWLAVVSLANDLVEMANNITTDAFKR